MIPEIMWDMISSGILSTRNIHQIKKSMDNPFRATHTRRLVYYYATAV